MEELNSPQLVVVHQGLEEFQSDVEFQKGGNVGDDHQGGDAVLHGFPLPPNPFPNGFPLLFPKPFPKGFPLLPPNPFPLLPPNPFPGPNPPSPGGGGRGKSSFLAILSSILRTF